MDGNSTRHDEVTMPAYRILRLNEHRDELIIQGDDLKLTFADGWAILTDSNGIAYAVPDAQKTSIERIDPQPDGKIELQGWITSH
ncbi:hypothetical protein QD712_25780 [Streptomyces acidiscabies]|uniref:hypothetical protein n=1 Tax=Streptomyces acidiscabies TaxID=42234 RepID=UPI0030D1F3D7